jgi:hypothetical protein
MGMWIVAVVSKNTMFVERYGRDGAKAFELHNAPLR